MVIKYINYNLITFVDEVSATEIHVHFTDGTIITFNGADATTFINEFKARIVWSTFKFNIS